MPNKYLERRSLRNSIEAYLNNNGWTGINFREGFLSEDEIVVPCVSFYFLPSNFKELQLGRVSNNSVKRVVQIDCYMESEPRADMLSEAIAEYIEINNIPIKEKDGNTVIGNLEADSETISWQTVPPILSNPKIIRWRGIVRATFIAYFYE